MILRRMVFRRYQVSDSKGNRHFSDKQEHQVANALGWSVVTGSGARHLYPGDISGIDWLGECKTHATPNRPILFDMKVWSKINEEAAARHRYPVLFVDDGSQKLDRTWCMIPESIDIADLHPEIGIVDYPKSIKSTATFIHTKMDPSKVYYCVTNDKTMYIMHFKVFEELFKR